MKERNLIEDNRRADHFSFSYYLHEEKDFRVEALEDLCQYRTAKRCALDRKSNFAPYGLSF